MGTMLGKERPGGRRVSRGRWQNRDCERMWPLGETLLKTPGLEWRVYGPKLMVHRKADDHTAIYGLGLRRAAELVERMGTGGGR